MADGVKVKFSCRKNTVSRGEYDKTVLQKTLVTMSVYFSHSVNLFNQFTLAFFHCSRVSTSYCVACTKYLFDC